VRFPCVHAVATTPAQRLGVSVHSVTQPYQPSPKTLSGRPARRPFRGLLGVHLRYGLHTRAVTVYRDTLSEGFSHFVTSMTAPVASGWSGCRVGFAPTGKRRLSTAHGYRGIWLPYVTGGLAVGELHAWDALTPASGSAFRAGWTIGAGIETVLAPNWTFKFEYLYMDLGSAHLFDIVPGIPETVSFRDNIFRIGINYKFWGPEPVRPLVTK
jgi:hypothetical protein